MQSVPITTDVVSSSLDPGEVKKKFIKVQMYMSMTNYIEFLFQFCDQILNMQIPIMHYSKIVYLQLKMKKINNNSRQNNQAY
jgi:hypothetical protein